MTESEFQFDFNESRLEGKTILLAGGTGGLGSAVAVLLAREGASLVIGYRSDSDRASRLRAHLEGYHVQVETVRGDLSDPEVRDGYITAARRMENEIYGLVCLVGDPARVKFDEAEMADLGASMEANYFGPILLARRFAQELQSSGRTGAIVLFSTMQAVEIFPSSIPYAAPKAALIHAARIMAKEWGGRTGIRVNVVAPGVNRAGMALSSIASGKYDFFVEKGIVSRFGRAEDVAKVVRLLVEPDNYITGQVITVDGGLTLRRDMT
jgi:3-oxoacyl-[acyl-carrier protein] reductase